MEASVLLDQRLEVNSLLLRSVECILFVLQLRLQPAQDLEIARLLGRQRAFVLSLELSYLRLLLGETRTRILQLARNKLGSVFRLLLPYFQILVDEQVRQLACHLLGDMGITRGIIYPEGGDFFAVIVPHKLDVNVFAHKRYLFIRSDLVAPPSIKMQLVNDQEKARAAKNLLRNTLQPVLQIVADIWLDIVFRHSGLLNQDQRARLITRRQNPARSPDYKPPKQHRYKEMDVSAANYVEVALQVKRF